MWRTKARNEAAKRWRGRRRAGAAVIALSLAGPHAGQGSTAPGLTPVSPYPPACFEGQRVDPERYEVDLEPPGQSFGDRRTRLLYPAACDAGNWAKDRYRRRTTLYLQARIADGRCFSYDAWANHDPFGDGRFSLFLTVAERIDDLNRFVDESGPARATAWTVGPADDRGLGPLAYSDAGAPVADGFDRWAAVDGEGEVAEALVCRKSGVIPSPICELTTLYDGARMTLTFRRDRLARLAHIKAMARELLACASTGPDGRPR